MEISNSSATKPNDTQNEVVIGVLAVQGSFYEHIEAITRLKNDVYTKSKINVNGITSKNVKIRVVDIRSSKDVSNKMRGLIIPGMTKIVKQTKNYFLHFLICLDYYLCYCCYFRWRVNNAEHIS